tara:strand:- start:323 stop:694 length:372 start_codon:yes stop_codon:yes gene_type:complete
MNKYYKQKEIHDYAMQQLDEFVEHDDDYLQKDITDIHHELFNTDYYIIYTSEAKQWLGDKVFEVIDTIKEYENDHFGNVTTDFSEPAKVVNMYVYIVGEYILNKMPKDGEHLDKESIIEWGKE